MNKLIETIKATPDHANTISVSKLVSLLKKLSRAYYNTGTSLVSDELYDLIRDILVSRDPHNPFLSTIGATKGKTTLPHFMPSLDKIKPSTNALDKWMTKYKGPYLVSDKLDGVSALLVFGEETKLYTRGDGKKGQNISSLLDHIVISYKDVPQNLAVRGELVISKNDFTKLNFSNARNTVSGLVNSKTLNKKVANITHFVAYSVINPVLDKDKQMQLLSLLGFETVFHKKVKTLSNNYLSKLLVTRRDRSKYDIDGIVVYDNKTEEIKNKNPNNAFAFKTILTDQKAETTVLDVEWNPTMDMILYPRVKFLPIEIGNVKITYASAFNAKFIVDNVIGPGAVIEIVRSGDVIPDIHKVIKGAVSGKPDMPKIPYKWNETKVSIIATNLASIKETVVLRRMEHFFRTMKVKYLGEGILKLFMAEGYDSIEKLIGFKPEDLEDVSGLGSVVLNKIRKSIDVAFKKATLVQFMSASHKLGRGLGMKKLKLVLDSYPKILLQFNTKTKKEWVELISNIKGFDTKTATLFVGNVKAFIKFFKEVNNVISIRHMLKINKRKSGKLTGKKFVLTGFRDVDMVSFIEKHGGTVVSNVSKNTYMIVYAKGTDSGKVKRGKELGVKMVERDEFYDVVF